MPAPVPPVTLAELTEVTRLLARAGATIYQLNTLRKHLELMKGGGLAKAAYPAKVKLVTVIISVQIKNELLTTHQFQDVQIQYMLCICSPLNWISIIPICY